MSEAAYELIGYEAGEAHYRMRSEKPALALTSLAVAEYVGLIEDTVAQVRAETSKDIHAEVFGQDPMAGSRANYRTGYAFGLLEGLRLLRLRLGET